MTTFKEDLQQLSLQIAERKNHVTNEETTKQALIIPFISLLGYDVFNPLEVRPEYVSDFAKKKGEKVDYAIFNANTDALIFVEAKSINENLEKHSPQLARYFNATPELKLAILTNGVEYHFFTDLNVINVMDDAPFFRFNIITMSDESIKVLELIRKQNFNTRAIIEQAEELIYAKDLDIFITRLLKEPSNDFIRFVLKDISSTRITTSVIDKFRPIIKKSILNAIQGISAKIQIQAGESKKDSVCEKSKAPANKNNRTEHVKNSRPSVRSNDEKVPSAYSIDAILDEVCVAVNTADIEDEPLTVAPSEDDVLAFSSVQKILQIQSFNVDALKFLCTQECVFIYTEKTDNWIASINLRGEARYVTLPFDQEYVTKNIGNLFQIEKCENPEHTRIIIIQPEDIYRLSRLFIKRFKELI